MDKLTEIRTTIECYQRFLEDLEEITSSLETSTGLGLFLQAEAEGAIYNPKLSALVHNHEALPWIKRDNHREDYIGILLLLWGRANAKIGEIAFLIEESIEQMQNAEDKILENMKQSANRQEGADNA